MLFSALSDQCRSDDLTKQYATSRCFNPSHKSTQHAINNTVNSIPQKIDRRDFLRSIRNGTRAALATAAGASIAIPVNAWSRDSARNNLARMYATREAAGTDDEVKTRLETLDRVQNEGFPIVGTTFGLAGGAFGLATALNTNERENKQERTVHDLAADLGKDPKQVRGHLRRTRRNFFKDTGKTLGIGAGIGALSGLIGTTASLVLQTPSRWWYGKRSEIELKNVDPKGKLSAEDTDDHIRSRDRINLTRQLGFWGIPAAAATATIGLNNEDPTPKRLADYLKMEKQTAGKFRIAFDDKKEWKLYVDSQWFELLPEADPAKQFIYKHGLMEKPDPLILKVSHDLGTKIFGLNISLTDSPIEIDSLSNPMTIKITKAGFEAIPTGSELKILLTECLHSQRIDPIKWKRS